MRFSNLLAVVGVAEAATQGFNYGATHTDGSPIQQNSYEAQFTRAQNLQGTSGWSSARLYTMIQGGTTNTPSSAIPAAINTKTTLLLGLWASGGQAAFSNELDALSSAITQYGTAFTDLIVGISVGSEDLYRITPTGIENKSGVGASPDQLVDYINQLKAKISGTPLSGASIGHVDTWTAWVNGSNNAVIDAVSWLGFDGYPYFQTVNSNGIENAESLFWESYNATVAAANGKPVWVTETGWPVSGPQSNLAVASTQNAQTYWDEVGCALFGKTNTWWYTLQDASPTTPSPSFGIIGSDLNSAPMYNLTCAGINSASPSSATTSVASSAASPTQPSSAVGSSTVSIVQTHGPEASGSVTASAATAVASGSATGVAQSGAIGSSQGGAASSSPSVTASGSASPAANGPSTFTTFLTTVVTVEDCPETCPTTLSTVTTPVASVVSTLAAGSNSAPAPASSSAATPAVPAQSSCPTNLNGDYQYPHLIVPVDSSKPSTAFGTSYNGTISPTVSSIFNFDLPASYSGKTCSILFLFPERSALETSDYSFNGKGGLSVSELSGPATEQTTYDTVPQASAPGIGSIANLQPGNSYVVATGPCGGGKRIAFEFSSTGGLDLNYFQDYNPSPLGAYITVC